MLSRLAVIAVVLAVSAGVGLPSAWASPSTPGDANFDGRVDELDAAILASHWQTGGMTWSQGDFTGDGWVNDLDASVLACHWLYTSPPEELGENPEPASLVIWTVVGLCATGGVWWRSRRGRR